MDMLEPLREVIVKVGGLPAERVTADTSLNDLGIDSLAVAQIIVELEMRLDLEFPVHLLRRLDSASTVGEVAAELEKALAGADPGQ